jgi:hypothetical protein
MGIALFLPKSRSPLRLDNLYGNIRKTVEALVIRQENITIRDDRSGKVDGIRRLAPVVRTNIGSTIHDQT